MNEYERDLAWVKEHRDEIVKNSAKGMREAQAVIEVHWLLVAHADEPTKGVFMGAVDAYKKARE